MRGRFLKLSILNNNLAELSRIDLVFKLRKNLKEDDMNSVKLQCDL